MAFIYFGAVIALLNDVIGGIFVVYAFKFAGLAGINQGIISSIFGFSPIMAAIIFYIMFRDRLNAYQIVGMLFIIS